MRSFRFVAIGCALVAGLGLCAIAFCAVIAHEQGWRAFTQPLGITGDPRFVRSEEGGERRRESERKNERTEPKSRGVAATAVPARGKLDPLSASHAGRSTCVACHEPGGAGPRYPSDHTGRADSTCVTCHRTTGAASPTVAPTSVVATPAATPLSSTAKPVPANHSGRTTCNTCHATGAAGPRVPADHTGRADSSCVTCHKAR